VAVFATFTIGAAMVFLQSHGLTLKDMIPGIVVMAIIDIVCALAIAVNGGGNGRPD